MVRCLIAVALAGCVMPAKAPPPEPEEEHYRFDPGPTVLIAKTSEIASSAPSAGEECPKCAEHRAALQEKQVEMEEATAQRKAFIKEHCQTGKVETVSVRPGGRFGGPTEIRLICDGKMVDAPISNSEAMVSRSIGQLEYWIRENCPKHRGHRCDT